MPSNDSGLDITKDAYMHLAISADDFPSYDENLNRLLDMVTDIVKSGSYIHLNTLHVEGYSGTSNGIGKPPGVDQLFLHVQLSPVTSDDHT